MLENKLIKNNDIIKVFCMVLLMGSLIGSVACNYMRIYYNTEVSLYIGEFFESKSSKISVLKYIENFINETKYYVAIWFIGFIPIELIKKIYILVIILIKGFFIGFTSALIIKEYGVLSLVYIIKNYSISSVIFILISFYIGCRAIKFQKKELERYIKQLIVLIIISGIFLIIFYK